MGVPMGEERSEVVESWRECCEVVESVNFMCSEVGGVEVVGGGIWVAGK